MLRTWIAGPVAAGLVLLGCGGESRVAAENETCMGGASSGAPPDYTAAGMPSAEPDLQAWVTLEQHGMTRVTTNPCKPRPDTRMLLILSEAPVVLPDGSRGTFSDVRAGQKISAWYAGGAKGKARAVYVERIAAWPPGSGAATPEPAAEASPPAADSPTPTASPAP
jgi:hypothetical protein